MLVSVKNIFCLMLLLCLTGAVAGDAVAQKDAKKSSKPKALADKKPPKQPQPMQYARKPGLGSPGFFDGDGVTSEKSMVVDPNVAIKLCVSEGNLKVNGWRRNEVRVFVKNGRKFRFKALEKSSESGKVNWLWVGNVVEGRPAPSAECLAGERIEIDAPLGANLDISGRSAPTSIDSVKKVKVKIEEGAVMLRNISGGINAYSAQGNVIVENSSGSIGLESTTGNIVAVEVTSGQIGDLFRARTNSGQISLRKVEHRQIDASSISGSLVFEGKFLSGGIYNFRTSVGSIRLAIPGSSSCTVTATYADGDFVSEIPYKILTQNITPQAKILVASIGSGDANVHLRASSGRITIKKQSTP